MAKFNDAKGLISDLSAQLTEDRLAEVRTLSGVGYLAPGSLTDLVNERPFSVEDIVTVLLSGWILQTEDIKHQAERICELESLCKNQEKAIDGIADQAMRLHLMLGKVFPDSDPVSQLDMLKSIAARAGTDHSTGR